MCPITILYDCHKQAAGHLMLATLKAGAMPFLTDCQCSLVLPVSRLGPARNCRRDAHKVNSYCGQFSTTSMT